MTREIALWTVLLLVSLGNRRINDWLLSFLSPLEKLKFKNDLFVYAMKKKAKKLWGQ